MQLSDFGVDRQRATLTNGTPVVVYHRPNMPVSLRIAFLSGSRFDPQGKEGLAHFAEHITFSGTDQFPTRAAIAQFVESKGAYFNASTGREVMTIKFDYPDASDTVEILKLLQQQILHTTMTLETVEQERGTILSELTRSKSNPARYVGSVWSEAAFKGTELERNIIGTEASLASINQDDLRQYFTDMLASNRAVVVASGGIEATELANLLELSPIMPDSPGRFVPTPVLPEFQNITKIERYPESSHSYLLLGLPAVTLDHPQFQDFRLISLIFGASQTSRLRQRLRNDLGLVYAIGVGMMPQSSCGHMYISTDCNVGNIQTVLDVIAEETLKLKNDGISEVELDHVKNYLAKSQKMSLQTSDEWADYHTYREILFPHLGRTIVDDLALIEHITTADIKTTLQNHLQLDGYSLAICGDVSAQDVVVNLG